jgi:Reverse transcriptase (RNA-dependent DNA polymerase)
MKQKNWFKPKAFTHLSQKLSLKDGEWIKNYVSNPENIIKHKFYPLIHRTIVLKRFKKSKGKNNLETKKHHTYEDGIRKPNVKYREIYYPNHLDAHIYSYYTQKILEPLYEKRLSENKILNDSILAYRRVPLADDSRCKCNIDFANEVFDEIKEFKGASAVLALDISKFFDSLDHKLLKKTWTRIQDRIDLEKDHYNVFKNLTNFSYVEMDDLLKEFGYKHANQLIQKEVEYFIKDGEDFRKRIKEKGYIKENPFRSKEIDLKTGKKTVIGIPQGTPISAFLANLYLLDFDNEVLELLESSSSIYRRYSDDILIICPKDAFEFLEEEIYKLIEKYKLVIQPIKTQRSFFENGKLLKGEKPVIYLGFQFDGHRKLIKSASLSKFYRKMKSSIKYRTFRAILAKKKRKKTGLPIDISIHRKKLYTQFSYLGSSNSNLKKRNYISYANFAARIMDSPHIQNQLSNSWGILHSEIEKQEKRHRLKAKKK